MTICHQNTVLFEDNTHQIGVILLNFLSINHINIGVMTICHQITVLFEDNRIKSVLFYSIFKCKSYKFSGLTICHQNTVLFEDNTHQIGVILLNFQV